MTNNLNVTQNGMKVIIDGFNHTLAYNPPSQFKVSINTTDVIFSDTTLTTSVPISGTETIDDCSATTGWTATGGAVSLNTSLYKPDDGTDGALNLTKTTTSTTSAYMSKTTTSVNGTGKDFTIWIYCSANAVSKLTGIPFILRIGSDAGNYYEYQVDMTDEITTGWNFIKVAVPSGFTSTVGSPSITALDYVYLAEVTTAVASTLGVGDVVFDSIRLASSDDYLKNFDSVSVDESDSSITTVSKLTITEANGFLLNGIGHYNTDGTPLMTIKGKFNQNSKGITDLLKITTKIKFRNITP